ncbi:MAG: hypothetical protein AB2A00_22825 [Myxococcota bacterium]
MRALLLLAAVMGCTSGSPTPDGPGPLGPNKTLSGPPGVWLLADGGVVGPLVPGLDGGWDAVVEVGARNVHPEGATLSFTLLDTVSMSALMPAASVVTSFDIENGQCVKRDLRVAVPSPQLVQGRASLLAVALQDRDGRQAETRAEVWIQGGPDAGALDAATGGLQMDGAHSAGGGG